MESQTWGDIPVARPGKWIEGTYAEQPVSAAARRALSVRLAAVRNWLPLAARHADRDVEYVHQLRVATRRAVATLRLFEDVLPARRGAWMRRRLRRLRRVAGDARDFDVLLERLSKDPDFAEFRGVWKRVRRLRRDAQPRLRKAARRLRRKKFKQRGKQLLRRVRWRGEPSAEPTFQAAARSGLLPLFDDFFAAQQALTNADIETLHKLRIAGKQVRYALEVYAGALGGAEFDAAYREVEKLQQQLGTVNDHATAAARYRRWSDTNPWQREVEALERLLAKEEEQLRLSRERFVLWWTHERAAAMKHALCALLRGDDEIGAA